MSDNIPRKGRMIKTSMSIGGDICYIGQYNGSSYGGGTIWIDLCYDNKEHIYGYTIIGVKFDGIKLCNPTEFISNNFENMPYDQIKIDGIDDI
jgi:hypothetical protein